MVHTGLLELDKLDYARSSEHATERTLLQSKEEVVLLVEWMRAHAIRSYLELGFFTGALLSTLDQIFRFKKVAGADDQSSPWHKSKWHRAHPIAFPSRAFICWAKTESPEYRKFRHGLGKMDLVFIDADHSYGSVRADYEREKKQPHRFLAFHDIKNDTHAPGVVRLWNELGGKKREIVHPGSGMGIGIWSERERP